ncbi:hypothetical protein H8D30_00095 [bacterium]|nr:hypothetical protein [bacterium]
MGWGTTATSIVACARKVGTTQVPLLKSLGTILAEDLVAQTDIPPRPVAGLDGYALAKGVSEEEGTFRLTAFLRTGMPREMGVGMGETVKVEEGALLPQGTERVVAASRAKEAEGYVSIDVGGALNTIQRGADYMKGDVLLPSGTRIGPSELALLSFMGVGSPLVRRIPPIALLTVGTELCGVLEDVGPGQVRDFNAFLLGGIVKRLGGRAALFGPAPDDVVAVAETAIRAVRAPGVVVISGGMGNYGKVTPQALDRIGFVERASLSGIRPAGSVIFGTVGDVFLFALPGNAFAAETAFATFVVPFLRKMAGERISSILSAPLPIDTEFSLNPEEIHLLRAQVIGGELAILPSEREHYLPPHQRQGEVIVVVDRGTGSVKKGDSLPYFSRDPFPPTLC